MDSKRAFYAMSFISILLTLTVGAAVYGGLTYLGKQSDKLVAVKLDNKVIEEQQTSLVAASKSIETYKDLDAIARAAVPQDKDQANSVRSISTIADSLGIKLSAISFPPSTLGQSSKAKKSTDHMSQLSPAPGLKNVFVLPITIQSDTGTPISYETFIEFLEKLENNRRTAQVNSISINPNKQNPSQLTFNLEINTYIRP